MTTCKCICMAVSMNVADTVFAMMAHNRGWYFPVGAKHWINYTKKHI